MVTHDNNLASYADRRIRIVDGKIVGIETGGRSALEEEEPGSFIVNTGGNPARVKEGEYRNGNS